MKVRHAGADCHAELVGINDTREWDALQLASLGFGQQILVPREEGAAQFCCPVQEQVIGDTSPVVILDCEHVDAS